MAPAPRDAERRRVRRPDARWEALVGHEDVKCELMAIAREVEGGPRWSDRALLLYGPPGCGKTSLVECLAAEWGRGDLVTVHGAELYSRFSVSKFGEARRHYDRARQLAPAVLHVKGLDLALGDVLAHLGGADRDDRVLVVVTNSAPHALPAAPRGPRRRRTTRVADGLAAFDQMLHVAPPTQADRARAIARGVADPADDLDFLDLAAQMDGFSYRAVADACAAATRSARRRSPKRGRRVLCDDFDDVLDAVPMLAAVASAGLGSGAPDAARRQAAEGLVCDWVDGGLAWRATTPAAERVLARYAATITVEEDDDGTTLRSPV
ncbi:ATP binding protein [Aureococcus anophagefferens]|nr:ATP binding protein [Aureococcus anophagefferens]